MKEHWNMKVFKEYKKEIVRASITALASAFVFGLLYFFSGKSFEWHAVHLSEPTLTMRILSGLVFDSLGYILYQLGFYYMLYRITVVVLRMRRSEYNDLKKIIWYFLMFFIGFYILPWIMNVINFILTIILNVVVFCVYMIPTIGIFIVIFFLTFNFLKKKKDNVKAF